MKNEKKMFSKLILSLLLVLAFALSTAIYFSCGDNGLDPGTSTGSGSGSGSGTVTGTGTGTATGTGTGGSDCWTTAIGISANGVMNYKKVVATPSSYAQDEALQGCINAGGTTCGVVYATPGEGYAVAWESGCGIVARVGFDTRASAETSALDYCTYNLGCSDCYVAASGYEPCD